MHSEPGWNNTLRNTNYADGSDAGVRELAVGYVFF
jgi:hypothetical protein